MSSGFPLLRTPQTVQTQIFNELNNYEAATVAMCSKKAYQHVKLCRSKVKKWRIDLKSNCIILKYDSQKMSRYTNDSIWIAPFAKIDHPSWAPSGTEIVDFNGYKLPVHFDPKSNFRIFWKDRNLALKIFTEYLCDLFRMNIHGLILDKSSLWMTDWLNSRQESCAMTEFHGFESPYLADNEYRHILTDCRATDKLRLNAIPPIGFKFDGNFPKPDILSIGSSRWTTLENLKSMDSINISLGNSDLKSSDMNLFLRHWLAGGSPRLSYMEVYIEKIIREDVFIGLKTEVVEQMRRFRLVDGRSENFKQSYDIERNDGVRASILFNDVVHRRSVCIVVWPVTK